MVGILLLMGGNLTLSWAELSVPSGLAALIVAITPLWFLVLDSLLLGHHRISWPRQGGAWGWDCGLFVLFWPQLHSTSALGRRELDCVGEPVGRIVSWALGSVLSKRWQIGHGYFQRDGVAGDSGGVSNFLLALAAGDLSRVVWTTRGVGAVALSGGVRVVDRVHGVHLVVEACADVEGVDVCVCESGGGGVSGMVGSA